MADYYLGEVRMFAGNFAPLGWLKCEGQLLPIAENSDLFALIGTTYGGDGQTTFALPDLSGRVPLGRTTDGNYPVGTQGGQEAVTLRGDQLGAHVHTVLASEQPGTTDLTPDHALGEGSARMYASTGTTVAMAADAVSTEGSGVPHENRQPFTAITFIIALDGIFPGL